MAITPLKGSNPPNVNTVLQSNPGDRVSPDSGKVAPIVAVMSRQLPLPQAQQLAGQTILVRVAKSGPGDNAELEFNGQKIPVKLPAGKALTAGEMITVSFALNNQDDAGAADGAKGSRKSLDVNKLLLAEPEEGDPEAAKFKSPSFVDKLSSSARLIGLLERLGQPKGAAPFQPTSQSKPISVLMASDTVLDMVDADGNPIPSKVTPTPAGQTGATAQASTINPKAPGMMGAQTTNNLNQTNAAANLNTATSPKQLTGLLAQQVSQAIETSGLFYESHLQQWANGERSKTQLFLEPQARFGAEQVISEKNIDPNAIGQSVRMVAQQLSALDQSKINVAIQGMFQQPIEIQIEQDKQRQQEEQAQGEAQAMPWVAKLKLDLPHLGQIEARLRISGQRLDLLLVGQKGAKAIIDQNWRDIQEAMQATGLELVHGQMRVTEEPGN